MAKSLPRIDERAGPSSQSSDDAVFAFGGDKGAAPRGFHDAVAAVNRAMVAAQRRSAATSKAKLNQSGKKKNAAETTTSASQNAIQLGDCRRYVDAGALGKWLATTLDCNLAKFELDALVDVFGQDFEGVARLDQLLLAVLAAGSRTREMAVAKDAAADASVAEVSEETTSKTSKATEKPKRGLPERDHLGRKIKPTTAEGSAVSEELSREEMDAYRRSSLSKLAAAARNYWFRRGNMAGDPIDRMRGGAMDPETFGHNLKISFHLNLHPVELQHLVQIFDVDGDGKVDGAEFVSLFLRLVDEERKKQVRAKAEAKERREEVLQGVDFKPKAKETDLSKVKWTQRDLRKGAAKLGEAAAMSMHNRLTNGAELEKAFYCRNIEPGRFVSMVYSILGVKLRAAEAAAIITTLAKGGPDKDPKESAIAKPKIEDDSDAASGVDGRKFLRLWAALAREEQSYYEKGELTWHA